MNYWIFETCIIAILIWCLFFSKKAMKSLFNTITHELGDEDLVLPNLSQNQNSVPWKGYISALYKIYPLSLLPSVSPHPCPNPGIAESNYQIQVKLLNYISVPLNCFDTSATFRSYQQINLPQALLFFLSIEVILYRKPTALECYIKMVSNF